MKLIPGEGCYKLTVNGKEVKPKKVVAYLGWEQEYFLVDEGLYAARTDLLMTGRTLTGHDSAKNQQPEEASEETDAE